MLRQSKIYPPPFPDGSEGRPFLKLKDRMSTVSVESPLSLASLSYDERFGKGINVGVSGLQIGVEYEEFAQVVDGERNRLDKVLLALNQSTETVGAENLE